MNNKYTISNPSGERAVHLDLLHGFGSLCSHGFRDSVSIIDDESRKILFPVGKYFGLKNYDRADMNFIKVRDNVESVICMAVSSNRKLLAISEKIRSDTFPQISIFNIKFALSKGEKEKTFRYTDTKSEQFIAMAFSGGDARFLVCLTNEPDYQIIFLDIARMKPISYGFLGVFVSRISINPKENHVICLSGPNYLKLLRVQENSFKPFNDISKLSQNQNFTDHAWFDDQKLIVTNDKGEIFIIHNTDLVQYIQSGFNEPDLGIVCLQAFTKGFIIGSEHGKFALWIKGDESEDAVTDAESFIFQRKWASERKHSICCINISVAEDLVAVSFKNNDIATFEMNQILPNTTETLEMGKSTKIQKEVRFDFIFNGFHSGSISSLDVCLQRPLIVTCSRVDSTIRIWNYVNFKCELARKFTVGDETNSGELNPLLSVAIHPSGYYLAAGFIDKLRFFHVMNSELRVYKEQTLKNCSQMRFSNGGQFLAAAYPRVKSNHYLINIYDSYTTELLTILKGHQNTINDLYWGPKDQTLFSCGSDGLIFEWKIDDGSKKTEYGQGNSKYYSIFFNHLNMVIVSGTEQGRNVVKEFRGSENVKTHNLGTSKITNLNPILSLYKFPAIIAGSDQGMISSYHHIFSPVPYQTIPTHSGEVTKIRSSPDGRYVFSSGDDGTIFIFQVSEITSDGHKLSIKDGDIKEGLEEGREINSNAMVVDEHLADVVLVPRSEIENYVGDQKKLKNELEDLENRMDMKAQDDKRSMEREKQEAKEKMNIEIQGWSKRYEELKNQKSQIEKENANLLKNMENAHLKAVEELESLYEKKLAFENEKYLQLEQDNIELRLKNENRLDEMKKKQDDAVDILQKEFRDKFLKAQDVYDSTKQSADHLQKMYEERLKQQEEEHEMEINDIKNTHKTEIESFRKEIATLKGQNEMYKRDNKLKDDDKDRLMKGEMERKVEFDKLTSKYNDANNRIEMLQKELEDREENLKKKEKKIYEYKYKINDLQKSKHVLSFRTTEMRKSLEPKEAQIEKLKEELFKLEGEFEHMLKTSQMQNDKMKKMATDIETLNKILKTQQQTTKEKEALINKITMDIHYCVTNRDPKEWSNEMKTLYQNYVLKQDIKNIKQNPRGIEEMSRQIKHLENCIQQMDKSGDNIIKRRELDIRKKTMENAGLICDLNEIRKQKKEYEQKVTTNETIIEHMKNENVKLKNENQRLKNLLGRGNSAGKDTHQTISNPHTNQTLPVAQTSPIIPNMMIDNHDPEKKAVSLLPLSSKQRGEAPNGKGKIFKGSNFDSKTLNNFDKAKYMDSIVELENKKQRVDYLETKIKYLKDKVKRHMEEKGCRDLSFDNELNADNDASQYDIYPQQNQGPNQNRMRGHISDL